LRKRFARKDASGSAGSGAGSGTVMHVVDESAFPKIEPAAPWVPLEAKRGTLVALHSKLPHWSSANRSEKSRHAYALHWVDDACRWSPDNWMTRRARAAIEA